MFRIFTRQKKTRRNVSMDQAEDSAKHQPQPLNLPGLWFRTHFLQIQIPLLFLVKISYEEFSVVEKNGKDLLKREKNHGVGFKIKIQFFHFSVTGILNFSHPDPNPYIECGSMRIRIHSPEICHT